MASEKLAEAGTPFTPDRARSHADAPPGTVDTSALAAELRATRDWRLTGLAAAAESGAIDLGGEDLRGVDFTGAPLEGASFRDARLAGARFAWARLAHADFTGATGLIGAQFARAELGGARMPATVRFVAFDTANEIAEGASKLFLTVMLVCAYSWLTIASTLDAKLLTDTAVSKLPIVNAEIPIVNFYTLVPIVLVGMALLLMLQAQRLWAAIAEAPAVMPDGAAMADRAGTWVMGAWAAERVATPDRRGWLDAFQARLFVLIGWWLVPATVAWFWGRYLHRHDWTGTLLQLAALTVGCVAAAAFLDLASVTLPRSMPRRDRVARHPWQTRLRPYAPAVLSALVVPLVFGLASYAAINGVHRGVVKGAMTEQIADARPALGLEHEVPAVRALLPRLMSRVGVTPVAQLSETEVSTRLVATSADTADEAKASGARLVGADLRFAAAERVFLALGDLRYANLLGANLWSADLRGANLVGAVFTGASLYGADLRKVRANAAPALTRSSSVNGVASVDTLFCSRVSFAAANLRYARLDNGDFRGASFDDGLLQGTVFWRARLTHASFAGADLDGADFRGAIGLTADQILAARHMDALFDGPLLQALLARSPDRMVTYDPLIIALDADRQRLSGEDEPDSLNSPDRLERDALIRRAFDLGASSEPSNDALLAWVASGKTVPGSTSAVPHGCFVVHSRAGTPTDAGR